MAISSSRIQSTTSTDCKLAFSKAMRARLVTSDGIFTKWQPYYAEKRIATFPVGNDKKPQIRR